MHAENIQINKVIGEDEKYVLYFTEKTERTFWQTIYIHLKWEHIYMKH